MIIGLVLAIVCATFLQYGVPWDEQGEIVYGSMLIDFYRSGFKDHSAFNFLNFRFYGGGFELPAALLSRVQPLTEYETRHLLSALLGVTGLIAVYRVGRRLFGARAGVLAMLLLVLNPTWYGNIFTNARDVPFATGMTLCLLLTLRMLDELPRISIRNAVMFGVTFGWTMSVRVGAVLGLVFLLAPIMLWFVFQLRTLDRPSWLAALLHTGKRLALICGVAYAVMAVLWPWAVMSPLNPLRALTMFSHFPFDSNVLFNGKLVSARALPASYLPTMLAIKSPELLVIAVGLAALFALWRLKLRAATPRIWTVVIAAAFPIVYFMIARPVAYNGMRHFLFVLPPLSVLGAYALDRVFTLLPQPFLRVSYGLSLAACALWQVQIVSELFPNEYVYYNSFVGGPQGAAKRYELDYWGVSLQEASERLVETLQRAGAEPLANEAPYHVFVCGNVWSASLFFPSWLQPVARIEEADYQIAIADFFCQSPPDSQRVLEVTRADTLLSYVDSLNTTTANSWRPSLVRHFSAVSRPP